MGRRTEPQRVWFWSVFFFSSLFAGGCVFGGISEVEEVEETSTPDSSWTDAIANELSGNFEKVRPVEIVDKRRWAELKNRGDYIVNAAAACGACHVRQDNGERTGVAGLEKSLAGGRRIEDRFGEVTVPNITPDMATGLGAWNVAEIKRAIRASIDNRGQPLSIDAHRGYRWMSDEDATAIAVYLSALAPVRNEIARRSLGTLERRKFGVISQHRDIQGYVPQVAPRRDAYYGRYLAHNLSRCYLCHTGSKSLFSSSEDFAGSSDDLNYNIVSHLDLKFPESTPDIRGTLETGLKAWSKADIAKYLSTGASPKGKQSDPRLCPWDYFKDMSADDKEAIAAYLKTL
ncbi:MAG: cytochrome c [Deltaproteobacteria bacterium]|nr:cytochrome c [Deltaproteobacteria bacterium]